MRLLTKDEVSKTVDRRYKDVAVPEWGEDVGVRVRTMTVSEHADFSARIEKITDDATMSAHLVISTVVGEDNALLFAPVDVVMLLDRSASAVKRIGSEAAKLNRMTKDAAEEARKNS